MLARSYCHVAVLLICTVVFLPLPPCAGLTYECSMEKRDGENVCVFSNVDYSGKVPDVTFKAPSGKVQHVAFQESSMDHLPKEFLTAFPDLRSLNVVATNLSSVVIPSKLERLYASNNRISRIIVHQTRDGTTMSELMLDSNQLRDVSNLTRLAKLEILNLSGNGDFPIEDTVDFERFQGMNQLRHLLLSDMTIHFIENEHDISLPELELLDLSNNAILTSSLEMKVFAPMKNLQYLRLAHNRLKDLNVQRLTENNPNLKELFLEGNLFKCPEQRHMLEHLKKAGVETPVRNKQARCTMGLSKQDDMCCEPQMPDAVPYHPEPNPEGNTRMPATNTMTETHSHNDRTTTTTTTTTTDSSAASVPRSNDGKNMASTVTLGNGAFNCVVALAVAMLVRF